MPNITLDWTVSLLGNTVARQPAGAFFDTRPYGFLGEFDAELDINWWADDEDLYGWEVSAVTVNWNTPPRRHIITKHSDPALWAVLERSFKADEVALTERIQERIDEALDDGKYEYVREAAE